MPNCKKAIMLQRHRSHFIAAYLEPAIWQSVVIIEMTLPDKPNQQKPALSPNCSKAKPWLEQTKRYE